MNKRFVFALLIVAVTVGTLIYSAAKATAKPVVTVKELIETKAARKNIRVGARVADMPIEQKKDPEPTVYFSVRDIQAAETERLPVVYAGLMPDTLKAGRDVILEGDFDGKGIIAKNLVTQCPSKYVPPTPGAAYGSSAKGGAEDKP